MINRISSFVAKHNIILLIFFSGLLLRLLVMPLSMHADLLSMSYRAHLMAEYGQWQLPTNQFLAHLVYGGNLTLLKVGGYDLQAIFPAQFGLTPRSWTASVGDWLTFNEHSQVNEVVFWLKVPHLLADIAVFIILARVFRNKNRHLVLALWWFNPVNLYAFYVFARHDALTALVLLLAMLFVVKDKIWPALVSVYAGIQIRVVPLLLLPVFMADIWKNRADLKRLAVQLVIAAGVIFGYVVFTRLLPVDTQVLSQISGREYQEVATVPTVGVPGRLANQATDTTIGGVPVFLVLYGLIGALFFFFAQKITPKARLAQLNTVLLMVMALYFAINPFSPHYFVWLSLFATLGIGFRPRLFWPYAGAVFGWLIMGAFASDSFAITQNLFMPVSTSLFRTPQIHQIMAGRGIDPQLIFAVGRGILSLSLLILAAWAFIKDFWPTLKLNAAQAKKAVWPLVLALGLMFVPTRAQALTAPVIENTEYAHAIQLEPGQTIGQTFISPVDTFGSVEIRLQTDRIPGQQNLIVRLKEQGAEEWYYQAEYDRNDFYNKYYYPFGFPPVTDALGKTYYLELALAEPVAAEKYPIKIMISDNNPYPDGMVIIDGEPQPELDMSFAVVADDTGLFTQQLNQTLQSKFEHQRSFFTGYGVLLAVNVFAIIFLLFWRSRSRD